MHCKKYYTHAGCECGSEPLPIGAPINKSAVMCVLWRYGAIVFSSLMADT